MCTRHKRTYPSRTSCAKDHAVLRICFLEEKYIFESDVIQSVWKHCPQASWDPSGHWRTQRATEDNSYHLQSFLSLKSQSKIDWWKWDRSTEDGKKCKNYLSMRFLWVAPLLPRIYSTSLLQVRVQHWEISQEICKLKNTSEMCAKWQNKLIITPC